MTMKMMMRMMKKMRTRKKMMTEEEMIVERKKKMKEIRKVMKEEEKLRQRDRETAATVSCSPTQPLPVVPPVKEETHSPELSPPPQKRLERPEQCRAFPTSVICRPRRHTAPSCPHLH